MRRGLARSVVVVLAATLVACSTSSGPRAASSQQKPSSSTAATSPVNTPVVADTGLSSAEPPVIPINAVTAVASDDGSLNLAFGDLLVITAEPGHLVAGTTVTASVRPESDVPPTPTGFTRVASPVDVDIADGAVIDLLRLQFATTGLPPDAIPVVLHLDELGAWEGELAAIDGASAVVEANSFSIRLFGWFNPGDWIDSAADWLTGRTDPPTDCQADTYPWVASGSVGVANGTIHACTRSNPRADGTERVEIKIKSNRNVYQWVDIPTAANDYVWVEGEPDWLRRILGGALRYDSDHRVLLAPGHTMTVGYVRPIGSSIDLSFRSSQNALSAGLSGLREALGSPDIESSVVAILECTGVLGGQLLDVATGTDWDLGSFLKDCVVSRVKDAAVKIAGFAADSSIREARFLVDNGIATKADLVRLSKRVETLRKVGVFARLAGRVLLAGDVFQKVTNLTADIRSQSFNFANQYNVTLVAGRAPPAAQLPAFDVGNNVYPPGTCGDGGPITIVGANFDVPYGSDLPGPFIAGAGSTPIDLDGDGVDEQVVDLGCSGGGNAVWGWGQVWAIRGGVWTMVADTDGAMPTNPTVTTELSGFGAPDGVLTAASSAFAYFDATCCPSAFVTETFQFDGSDLNLIAPAVVSAEGSEESGFVIGLLESWDVSQIATPNAIAQAQAIPIDWQTATFAQLDSCFRNPTVACNTVLDAVYNGVATQVSFIMTTDVVDGRTIVTSIAVT